MNLAEGITLFLEARRGIVSAATHIWDTKYLEQLGRSLGEERPIEGFTLDELRGWRATLFAQSQRWERASRPTLEGGLSLHTIDDHVRACKHLFKWLHEEGRLPSNPAAKLERPRLPEKPPRWLEEDEVKALMRAARASTRRNHALVRFFLHTGVRVSEGCSLEVEAMDLERRRVWVTGKGNKRRRVFWDTSTHRVLLHYLGDRRRGPLWISPMGKALAPEGVRTALRRLSEAAGIERVGPHQLRHTFAYWSLKRGVDPDLVRRQLGHADLQVLYAFYVRWIDDDLEEAFSESWFDEKSRS